MKNLLKKGLLLFLVFSLIVSALPVTAAEADDFPDNALIIVGGKTVTKDMCLSDVKKLFGEPKLETVSPFGGKACTFYGDNYSDYLYIETNAKDGIAAFGSISEGYRTPKYSFGDKDDYYVSGTRMTDNNGNILGYVGYYYPNIDLSQQAYQDKFFSDIDKYDTALCRHAVLMFNGVSKLYGYDTPVVFDENTYAYNLQLAENGSNLIEYAENTGKEGYVKYSVMGMSGPYRSFFNPLDFANGARKYKVPDNINNAAFIFYMKDGTAYYVIGYVNPDMFDLTEVEYTDEEKETISKMHDIYVESVELYNSGVINYYVEQPSYDTLPITAGKINENVLKGAVLFLNCIRVGAGLSELQMDEELCQGAQAKATYTAYLSRNGISNPSPHNPPKVEGISDEFYELCQLGYGENLFWGEALSSIYKALDDSAGDPINAGHRYNLLDPSYTNIGIGTSTSNSMSSQGVHKFSGNQKSDVDLISWPSKGVTPVGAFYRDTFNWTTVFYSDYSLTDSSSVNVKHLNTGREWNFSDSEENTNSHYFYRTGSQMSFYDSGLSVSEGDVYLVTLKNVKDKATGEIVDYSYRSVIADVYSEGEESEITSIKLDKNSADMAVGETLKLGAALQPTAPKNAMVYWSTSDETVANVSPNGVVTALKEGTVTITAMSEDGGLKDTCVITVGKKEETLMGDVNLDGVLSIADATMVQSYLAQSVSFNDKQIAAADFNNDGSISVADVTAIQTAIANS